MSDIIERLRDVGFSSNPNDYADVVHEAAAELTRLREALAREREECSQLAWDIVGQRIEATPRDGINAEGDFNLTVFNHQDAYINGMRSARLAVRAAIRSRDTIAKPEVDD